MRSNISLEKDKKYVIASERLDKNYFRFRAEKYLCTFVSCIKYPFERHNIVHGDDCVITVFPRRVINWHVLQIAKAHFVNNLVHDFWKKYHEVHVFLWTHGT